MNKEKLEAKRQSQPYDTYCHRLARGFRQQIPRKQKHRNAEGHHCSDGRKLVGM